jgi:predicted alpha/beta superfamily hydrolase
MPTPEAPSPHQTHDIEAEELGRATIAGSRRYALTSRLVDQTFIVDVARPAIPTPANQPLPVIYVLDADGAFGVAAQAARMLQMETPGLPPVLVVGVGYRYSGPKLARAEHGAWRTRDFTPSLDRFSAPRTRAALAEAGYEARVRYGGAAAFLAFLTEELRPFVAGRYAINPSDQTLLGMSLGGLFSLYALFKAPAAFNRHLIVSPALWWDERIMFAEEAAYAEKATDLPAKVFLGVGASEEADGAPYWPVSNLADMDAALRGRRYPGLHLTHHVFPDETHMSVYPGAVSRGLRALFK